MATPIEINDELNTFDREASKVIMAKARATIASSSMSYMDAIEQAMDEYRREHPE